MSDAQPTPPAPQPAADGYAPNPYASAAPTEPRATVSHALGFLAWIPVPFFNFAISGVAQLVSARGARRRGGLAARQAASAGNWAITQLVVGLGSPLAAIAAAAILSGGGGTIPPEVVWVPFVFLALYLLLGITHLVVTIWGTVVTSRGEVFTNRIAFPIFRE